MPTYSRSKSSLPEYRKESGERVNQYTGTFVGYVKDNRDAQKNGRLKIWIPELGGDPEDSKTWFVASYASPFAGATPVKFIDEPIEEYKNTQTSYGFWMVPPDVDNQVLVCFANGDSTRCFWFACLYNNFMNQQVPGMAASTSDKHYGPETTTDDIDLPTAEYNKIKKEGRAKIDPDTEKKPVQPYVSEGLREQGLIFDEVRGVTSASARRESPSEVYGFSTPGPVEKDNSKSRKASVYKSKNPGKEEENVYITRKGGHRLVFDDSEGKEQIKITTRSGAEIILDESNGLIYLINAKGTAWLEMSDSGHVDIFSKKSMSVRSEKDINMRADRDFNIEAGRNVSIKSAKDYVSSPASFLLGYANSQQKTLSEIFSNTDKLEYLKDFPNLLADVKTNKITVNEAFNAALKEKGFPTESSARNKYSRGQQTPSYTSLTAVEKLALLRGSHIVGEGFGEAGDMYIDARQTLNITSGEKGSWSVEEDSLNFFAGTDVLTTAGLEIHNVAGMSAFYTAGENMNISSGLDCRISSGQNLDVTSLVDTKFHFRGDVNVLLEGLKLDIEAQPVKFDLGQKKRVIDTENHHVTSFKFQEINTKAEAIKTTLEAWGGSSTYPSGGPRYDMILKPGAGGVGTFVISNVGGKTAINTSTFDVKATQKATLTNSYVYSAVVFNATPPSLGFTVAHEAEVTRYYPENGPVGGLPWPTRAESAGTAEHAKTPIMYSKVNVLPTIKYEGNKEYGLTYHTQIVESTVRRFNTHEPCIEHENLGNAEQKNNDIAKNLKFRILD